MRVRTSGRERRLLVVQPVRIGLALPQYDYSVPGESPLTFDTVAEHARACRGRGYDSLWLSDHLFLDLAKYGGSARALGRVRADRHARGARRRRSAGPRLGTLVLCEALRPPTVLAKALATLDRITGGRLDVGLGAGWYEPEYEAIGMAMPPAGRPDPTGCARRSQIVTGLLGGRAARLRGRVLPGRRGRRRPAGAAGAAPARVHRRQGRPRASRRRVEHADGWNTCWVWTPEQYRERLEVVERACDAVGRDPATFWRCLGLYALVRRERGRPRPALRAPARAVAARSPRRGDASTSGGSAGSSGRWSRSASRRPRGRSWASRPSSWAPGASRSRWSGSRTSTRLAEALCSTMTSPA